MKYVPLHVHSHFSLLDGLSQPKHIAERIVRSGLDACALTDHGNISGVVQFIKAMDSVCECGKQKDDHPSPDCKTFTKKKLKPILGCELYVCNDDATLQVLDNRKLTHIPVVAKNLAGWKDLIKLTSCSNKPEHFYHRPRLSLKEMGEFLKGNIIGFSGHLGSHIANVIVENDDIKANWENDAVKLAETLQDMFGKGNFYLEVQLYNKIQSPIQAKLTECTRKLSKLTGIPCIATPDAHYAFKEQAVDQRVLLCRSMKTTMRGGLEPTFALNTFFHSDNFHIPSAEEMLQYGHTEEELANTLILNDSIESYDIMRKPTLPPFPCPKPYENDNDGYLRYLCREGWKKLIRDRIDAKDIDKYANEVKRELEVFKEAKLAGYFLICQDIVNFVRKNGWLPGPGRGSAAGCLVSYLIGITSIDPIPYDLLFERFYNSGRNTADHISYPDIDMDVPKGKREAVIDYMKYKFGSDKVAQIITYQTEKGRQALKDVLRAHADLPFEERNRITKNLPDPAKVAGELQHMKEEHGESSLIRLALEEYPAKFAEWCHINDKGELEGPLADRFAQAIRLEGTKVVASKHAAGIILSPEALTETCPMVLDVKKKQLIAGMEMNDLEAIGMIKFDILGVAMLDKIMGIRDIVQYGDIRMDSNIEIDDEDTIQETETESTF